MDEKGIGAILGYSGWESHRDLAAAGIPGGW